jgi:hypothetical protein
MGSLSSPHRKLSSSQISVAAESIVTAQFALAGFDVLEQPGRARPFYDLGVARAGGMMKISVHASFNGFWDLADRYMDGTRRDRATADDYHRAIEQWRARHNSQVKCCLVEFERVALNQIPRIYLATAGEVASALHERIDQLTCEELGPLGLDVAHRAQGMPAAWRFSQERIAEVMELPVEQSESMAQRSEPATQYGDRSAAALASPQPLSMMN